MKKKMSVEHKKKISQALTGKVPSLEHRKNQSIAQKTRFARDGGNWLNKKRPELSLLLKGRTQSKQQTQKMLETRFRNGSYRKLTTEERLKRKETAPRGKNHYNWKGGITPKQMKIRMSLEMKLWREAVFARDNFTCVWCFERGGKLNADHIKPFSLFPELRFSIDNGRTLCIGCHAKTDTYRGKMKNYNCKYHR